MKKTLLLLAICLVCFVTYAQQIDRSLLYGKWEIHDANIDYHCTCLDSSGVALAGMLMQLDTGCYFLCYDFDDSVEMADDSDAQMRTTLEYQMIFQKNGTAKVTFGYCVPESDGVYAGVRGRYKWTGENNIRLKTKKSTFVSYSILSLTATKLVLIADANKRNKDAQMILRRLNK